MIKTQDVLPNDLSGMSRELLVDTLRIETAENHRLRAVLLELASRPEITADTRQWLATKIREKGKEPIVRGLREEERELVDGLRKWASKITDLVLDAHPQTPENLATESGQRAYADWHRKLDAHSEQIRHFLQECDQQFGRTIEDLEEAR